MNPCFFNVSRCLDPCPFPLPKLLVWLINGTKCNKKWSRRKIPEINWQKVGKEKKRRGLKDIEGEDFVEQN